MVTYTIAEAYALADVFTPGVSIDAWVPYRHGWEELKTHIKRGAPSLERGQAALWYQATVGGRSVVVVKSELHPSTDGIELPIRLLWQQLIDEAAPSLVITTGTAGAVGAEVLLGDVVVTQTLRWDCSKTFAGQSWAHQTFTGTGALNTSRFAEATSDLLPVNGRRLPDPARDPQIWSGSGVTTLTTDFFAFDDAEDRYGLRAYQPTAHAVEMDDAALALTLDGHANAPTWVSVRNTSDPQVNGPTLQQERTTAAAIYERYGYITSIGSLIASWALLAPPSP